MQILEGFKYQLVPRASEATAMRRFSCCCRFLWNKALALEKETYETEGKRLGYYKLADFLREWKKEESTSFLSDAHSQILQKALKDLDGAYKNFFEKRAAFPRFKKKGLHDSFRYPQGFKVDEHNNRVFLPKNGWVRYRNSRRILGTPKQITVSLSAGKWYVSVQTERKTNDPVHPSKRAIGIGMGIARFATLSNGTYIEPLNSFRKHEAKLVKLQRKLSKKAKILQQLAKTETQSTKTASQDSRVRNDFLHKNTTTISKNHAMVVMEDL